MLKVFYQDTKNHFLSGYYPMLVKESDCEKTAFVCSYGLLCFERTPIGLCNMQSFIQ